MRKTAAEYRATSRAKRGPEYWRLAVARSRAKDTERTRFIYRLQRAKRRARLANARTEKYIQKTSIHNWESKICGICGLLIGGDYHIDHIVPLSRGGEHCSTNLQLAHPYCNQAKFNHLLDSTTVIS